MVSLAQLWLPILLSAVFVFVASSLLNMVLRFWHGSDYHGVSNEDEVRATIRKNAPTPGMYMVPYCKPEDMKKSETQAKFKEGPVAFLFLRPSGDMNMAKPLIQWFLFCVLVSLFAAYVGGLALPAGASMAQVFRIVGAAALMGHAFGSFPMGIWWGHPWNSAIKYAIDGVIYAVIVAGTFGWLWPKLA